MKTIEGSIEMKGKVQESIAACVLAVILPPNSSSPSPFTSYEHVESVGKCTSDSVNQITMS